MNVVQILKKGNINKKDKEEFKIKLNQFQKL